MSLQTSNETSLSTETGPTPVASAWTFPLSFLIFLMATTSVFFALWSVHVGASIGLMLLIMPGLMRTMWVFERHRMAGQTLSFSDQTWLLLCSSATVFGAVLIFALLFASILLVLVAAGYVFGYLCLGGQGDTDGAVMGVVIGLPVAAFISAFLAIGALRLAWGGELHTPVDVRN